MSSAIKRDGFCRAPRIEMVSEDNRVKTLSFDEMLDSARFDLDAESSLGVVRVLANSDENGA